ncbi:MAG TPA: LysE family translocator [Burkholderiaceae bacterium]|nr:LysE family translocator [Burkholderiaceae bacterium]
MTPDQFFALVLFALTGSFTPGPNNTIATITGANFGWRAAVPHILGVPFGFASMLLAAAAGVAALILASSTLIVAIKWLGIAYLLWLAWTLAHSRAQLADKANGPFRLPLTFSQSALFQYLNPKAWMLTMATAGAFLAGDRPLQRGAVVMLVFSLCAFASLVVWAWLGAALRQWLTQGTRLRAFNRCMAALLAATALWMGFAA